MIFGLSKSDLEDISDEEDLETGASILKITAEIFQIKADQEKCPLKKAEFISKSEQKYIEHEKFIIKYIL